MQYKSFTNPLSYVITMYLSSTLLLATNFTNIFFFLVTGSVNWAVNHKIKSHWPFHDLEDFGTAPMVPNTKILQRSMKDVMCVLVLISSHGIWQLERERERTMGFRSKLKCSSLALQYGNLRKIHGKSA